MRAIAIALAAAAVVAALVLLARRADGPDATSETRISIAQRARGNYSAARNHALTALAADPKSIGANLALAQAYNALGEGGAAEGALTRALAAGLSPDAAHALLAEARLLQGDAPRALTEVAKVTDEAVAVRLRARARAAAGDPAGAAAMLTLRLADAPEDGAAWIDLANIRLGMADMIGAGDAAARATRFAPQSPEAFVVRGKVIRSQYGLVAALPWFEAALQRDAYYHDALVEHAATMGEAGRYRDMLSATRRALAARPGSPRALYLMAVMAARAGATDLARAMIAKTGGALNAMPGMMLLAGGVDLAQARYAQAQMRLRGLVARQPMNVAARQLLGAAVLRGGDARGALDVLRPIALRGDADAYTLTLVGRAFEQTGERDWATRFLDRAARPSPGRATAFAGDDALPRLEAAAAEAPDDPAASVALVRAQLDAGSLASATARAQALARTASGSAQAQLLIGDVAAAGGNDAAAARAFAAAAGLSFDTPTMLRLVDALARSGNRAGAGNALALYLPQNPQSLDARRIAATLQLGTRDWDAAIDTLDALRSATGLRDMAILAALATAHAGAGDAAAARSYGRAAYRLQPMSPLAADAYGWALYNADDFAGAAQLLRKAAKLAPGRGEIHWHLAQALGELNRDAEARAEIEAALRDPAFLDRAAGAALLKAL